MKINTTVERPNGICGILAAVEGFGKTTLAAQLPGALFLDADRGTYGMDVARIENNCTIGEFEALIEELKTTTPGQYRTVVIDTVDALEMKLTADYCKLQGWPNMEADYGIRWKQWKPKFAKMLDDLKTASKRNGWNIFFTAHVEVKEFHDPLTATTYNRVTLKTVPSTSALLKEWCDIYMTGLFVTDAMTEQAGIKKISHAISGKRMCYFEHNEKYDGKCRACVQLNGGKRFPASAELDKVMTLLPGALEFSTSFTPDATSERVTVDTTSQETPASEPLPFDAKPAEPEVKTETETPDDEPAHLTKLRGILESFKISESEICAYLKTKPKLGYPDWTFAQIPASVVDWIAGGITMIASKIRATRTN